MKKKKRVSIWKLLFTLLFLSSCGQANNKKSSQNTRYFNEEKYTQVYKYYDVVFSIDEQMRFDITWNEIDSHTQEETGVSKHWLVYLNGYYRFSYYQSSTLFCECLKLNDTWDYYLFIL